MQSVVWDEAVKINGADPDFHRRDLWDAIEPGDFPEWELGIQVFDDALRRPVRLRRARRHQAHPRGARARSARSAGWCSTGRSTTSSPRPSRSRSAPQNIVPGIDFTNDPLLQGRNFSYLDTQLKRLGGPELHPPAGQRTEVPDRPLPAGRAHGDGEPGRPGELRAELVDRRGARAPRGPARRLPRSFPEAMEATQAPAAAASFADHYSQAGQFFRSQTPVEQQHIVDAFVFELSKVENAGDPRRGWSPTCATSTRTSPPDRRRASGWSSLPAATPPAVEPDHDLPPSPALSILDNGPVVVRRPQGRRPRHRRERPDGRSRRCGAAAKAERPPSRSSPPRSVASTLDDGIASAPPTRWSAAARRSSTTQSRCCTSADGTTALARDRPRRTSSPTPTPTRSSSGT